LERELEKKDMVQHELENFSLFNSGSDGASSKNQLK